MAQHHLIRRERRLQRTLQIVPDPEEGELETEVRAGTAASPSLPILAAGAAAAEPVHSTPVTYRHSTRVSGCAPWSRGKCSGAADKRSEARAPDAGLRPWPWTPPPP